MKKQVREIGLPEWYKIALKELGVHEVPGVESDARILQYHKSTDLGATNDEVPWCAAFACWCIETSGIKSPHKANARAFLDWGQEVEEPYEGCVVVFRRGISLWQGHVGFFIKYEEGMIQVLGGNQGDQVCIRNYPAASVLGFREPTDLGPISTA